MPNGARRTVDVASTPLELQALVSEWAALVGDSNDVFAIPGVAAAWWEHLGRGRLHVISVRDDRRLVAVAPLHVRRILGVRVARWLGHGLGVIGDIVSADGERDAVLAIWEHLAASGFVLDLVDVPHDAGSVDSLRSCTTMDVRIEPSDQCHVIDLDGTASISDYLGDRSGLARSIRRVERGLAAEGVSVRSAIFVTPTDVRSVVPDLVRISSAADRGRPRHNLFGPRHGEGFTAMLDAAASIGHLVVSVLYLGDEPASFDVCFQVGTTLKDYYGRFDPRWGHWSPGALAQQVVVDYAIGHGISRVDLLLGDHTYKRRWSTSTYQTVDVLAAGHGRMPLARAWKTAAVASYVAKTGTSNWIASTVARARHD